MSVLAGAVEVDVDLDRRLLGGAATLRSSGVRVMADSIGGRVDAGSDEHVGQRLQELVVLVGRADGDAETVVEPGPARTVTDQHAAVDEALPDRAPVETPGRTRNSTKLAPLGNTSSGRSASAASIRSRSATICSTRCVHVVGEPQRQSTGDLLDGVEVVRQHHLVEFGDEPRRSDEVAESGPCHRPGLRERAGRPRAAGPRRRDRARVQSANWAYASSTTTRPGAIASNCCTRSAGSTSPVGLFGEREEHDVGLELGDHAVAPRPDRA